MTKRVCVLLSGCGAFDGSDIHEAVLTQLAFERVGAQIIWAAPDMNQRHVMNHLTQEEMEEQRQVLVESARIARGNIVDAASLDPGQLDALILPGGFGPVKNLSNFALKGPPHSINPNILNILQMMCADNKPIGAIGMAAVVLVMALQGQCLEVTIGDDQGLADAIEALGSQHRNCPSDKICMDAPHKIVTTPAYMAGTDIQSVAEGIQRLAQKIVELID